MLSLHSDDMHQRTDTIATDEELSVEEAAARLDVSAAMVRRRIEAGLIPARRIESGGVVDFRLRAAEVGLDPGQPPSVADIAEIAEVMSTIPEPARGHVELTGDDGASGPAAELMALSLDPRQLVAGLLDRWERTLERRIHAEQRHRFEAELLHRQSTIRQLQLELESIRAQQAVALADRERVIEEQRRALDSAREEQARATEEARIAASHRRGWFRR